MAMYRDAALSKDRLRQECSAAAAAFEAHLHLASSTARNAACTSTPSSLIKLSEPAHPVSRSKEARCQSLHDHRAADGNRQSESAADSLAIPPRVRTPRHHRPMSSAGHAENDLYRSWADLKGQLQPKRDASSPGTSRETGGSACPSAERASN